MWGTLNINTFSHVPSDQTYVDPQAFSEPETRATRDLVAHQLFGGVLTYHSYSQLTPTRGAAPPGPSRTRPTCATCVTWPRRWHG